MNIRLFILAQAAISTAAFVLGHGAIFCIAALGYTALALTVEK